MPRLSIHLDHLRSQVIELRNAGSTIKEILQYINTTESQPITRSYLYKAIQK